MLTDLARSIHLETDVPGPRSAALVQRRRAAVPVGLSLAHSLAFERAQGALLTDVDGNVYLDFVGGIGVQNTGHCPPEVVAAVREQAAKLLHVSSLVAVDEPYVKLCERLNRAVPISAPTKTLLATSGAEAVENAVKIARAATGRPALITFEGAYHGRTLMTMSLTSKWSFKKSFGPFAPEVYRAPFPYAYRLGVDEDTAVEMAWAGFERVLAAHVSPETVAAVIVEPVQGEGGFIPAPAAFLQRLRDTCSRHGMLLIVDEVQCGFGRSGTLFAVAQAGVEPDLLTSAKSIAAGLPLAAVTGRAEIMDAVHVGGLGGTYGGGPLACVAALAVMDVIERDDLPTRAGQIGSIVAARGQHWLRDIPLVGDVRGLGAMRAVELVRDRVTREPASDEAVAVVRACAQRGLLTMRAGLYANCVRLLMPLVITDAQLEEGLDVLEESLRSVSADALPGQP